jgi:dihydrodipicolinate synthase/N-acetylneuraminate lyase
MTELTKHAVAHKVFGCLMGTPFYYAKSSNQGLINSYAHVINAVSEKKWFIYLHNNPFVISGFLPHAVITELLRMFPNYISGILDASENLTTSSESALPSINGQFSVGVNINRFDDLENFVDNRK